MISAKRDRRYGLFAGRATGLALSALAIAAQAQRASENAVTAAEDAFGVTVGDESIGLYSSDNVRGFSAVDAGNVRLDGLYFDPVATLSPRLQRSATVRVGIAAQGFAFPAPTGVIDYALKRPGDTRKASAYLSADSYQGRVLELDAETPIVADTLAVGVGASVDRDEYENATSERSASAALMLAWRPVAGVELQPFWSLARVDRSEAPPSYLPSGETLPPHIPRRVFVGPAWAAADRRSGNAGLIAHWRPDDRWQGDLGLFRSSVDAGIGWSNLILDIRPDGQARQLLVADPPSREWSNSGELRLSRDFIDGGLSQTLSVNARGRERERSRGGSDAIDLGPLQLGERQSATEPPLQFTAQDHDRLRQASLGVAYKAAWRQAGEMTLSVQRVHYEKVLAAADGSSVTRRAAPTLVGLSAAAHITGQATLYASFTDGLEDSGNAPSTASNRNEPLTASRTRQADLGVRVAVAPRLTLVAGAFDLRKPYFDVTGANVYSQVADQEVRGVEISLSGALGPRLDIVAGGVLARPRVTGQAVQAGRVGTVPVAQPRQRFNVNAEWRPAGMAHLSLDAGLSSLGRRAATSDDAVHVPGRITVDLGMRSSFRLGAAAAQLRLAVTNVGNVYGYDVSASGVYDMIFGRVFQVSLGVDV